MPQTFKTKSMPDVNDELIDKLSALSKLEFDAVEKDKIKSDLSRILGFVEQLNKVDVSGVEPLIYINEDVNVLRKDIAETGISREEALSNAPHRDSDYFKVPKVLKKP